MRRRTNHFNVHETDRGNMCQRVNGAKIVHITLRNGEDNHLKGLDLKVLVRLGFRKRPCGANIYKRQYRSDGSERTKPRAKNVKRKTKSFNAAPPCSRGSACGAGKGKGCRITKTTPCESVTLFMAPSSRPERVGHYKENCGFERLGRIPVGKNSQAGREDL